MSFFMTSETSQFWWTQTSNRNTFQFQFKNLRRTFLHQNVEPRSVDYCNPRIGGYLWPSIPVIGRTNNVKSLTRDPGILSVRNQHFDRSPEIFLNEGVSCLFTKCLCPKHFIYEFLFPTILGSQFFGRTEFQISWSPLTIPGEPLLLGFTYKDLVFPTQGLYRELFIPSMSSPLINFLSQIVSRRVVQISNRLTWLDRAPTSSHPYGGLGIHNSFKCNFLSLNPVRGTEWGY